MAKQALEGLKVVEFCWAAAGPLVGRYLAQHGATVVRVESTKRLDIVRLTSPFTDNKPGVDRSGVFDQWNDSKFGMALDLNHPKGIDVAKRLVAWADMAGESFTPGVMNSLGLDYEVLKKVKPDIIMYSSSNLGQTGPEAKQPGFGLQLVAYSGFTHLTGWPDRMPSQPYGAYTDFIAPRFMVVALMAAVEYRNRTGKGQYIDVSQMETSLHFLAPEIMDYTVNNRVATRNGNKSPHAAPHNAYKCKGDDRWCAIAVFTDDEWDSLCKVMGNPEWTADPRFASLTDRKENEAELDERLSEWTKSFTPEHIMEKLQERGVPAGVLKTGADIQDDRQLNYRQHYIQLEHPEMGKRYYEAATGFILSETPADICRPSPLLGQHTGYVCREILGMSDEEFDDLSSQGVFE